MTDINLAMVLSLKDKLVAPLGRAVDQVERGFKNLEQQAARTARSSATVADNLGKLGRTANATRQAADDMRKLGDEAARTNRELGKLATIGQSIRTMMNGVTRGVAGAYAFSHVVAEPLRQAADYDTTLRQLANTAYGGRPIAERRAGMKTLDQSITAAVRFGGGSRDQAVGALGELISSGVFDPSQAGAVLPMLMRGATASGAQASDLATIAIRARQSMGITDAAGMSELLDRSMAAGQAGGFELKDMAKWLPQQMAAARSLGMRGMSGMTELLAANQASVITAGSRDEAGNNMVNLLGKINSADTSADFKKIGIDLTGTLARANSKGMSSLDAFVSLVDKVVSQDPKYAKAKAAADSATGDERKALLGSQVDLLQGSAVGKVIQDRQALMALVGLMGNRDYVKGVRSKIDASKGTINDAAGLMSEGAGYAFDQREFGELKAKTEAMNTANSAAMELAKAQTNLYERYPGFAQALEGAKVAVTGLAVAAGAAGVAGLLTGGGGGAVGTVAAGGIALGGSFKALLGMGAVATLAAAGTVAAHKESFQAVGDNEMLSAMSGDAGLAGAIMGAAGTDNSVNVNVYLDGRQIEAAVTKRQDNAARRN